MTDENKVEQRERDSPEFVDELSDEALDRPPAGNVFICVGICGSE